MRVEANRSNSSERLPPKYIEVSSRKKLEHAHNTQHTSKQEKPLSQRRKTTKRVGHNSRHKCPTVELQYFIVQLLVLRLELLYNIIESSRELEYLYSIRDHYCTCTSTIILQYIILLLCTRVQYKAVAYCTRVLDLIIPYSTEISTVSTLTSYY
jgi:hypothetical protein